MTIPDPRIEEAAERSTVHKIGRSWFCTCVWCGQGYEFIGCRSSILCPDCIEELRKNRMEKTILRSLGELDTVSARDVVADILDRMDESKDFSKRMEALRIMAALKGGGE